LPIWLQFQFQIPKFKKKFKIQKKKKPNKIWVATM
jgi:hypothetical protein